jgi:hypothetical protein
MVYTIAPYAIKGGMTAYKAGSALVKYAPYARAAYGAVSRYRKSGTSARPKRRTVAKTWTNSGADTGHSISTGNFSKKKKSSALAKMMKITPQQTQRWEDFNSSAATSVGNTCWSVSRAVYTIADLSAYAPNATNNEARFFAESGYIQLLITNASSVPAILKVYDVKCKKDCKDDVLTAIDSVGEKYNVASMKTHLFVSPHEAPQFRQFWKIENQKQIIMSPGETYMHKYFFDLKKFYYNNSQDSLAGNVYKGGFTHQCVFNLTGTPVLDSANVATCSIADVRILTVSASAIKFRQPQGSSTNKLVSTLSTTLPNTFLGSERAINEDIMAGQDVSVLT